MQNFRLSLPTDIPWRRKCVSEDMLDPVLCDRTSPFKWRSSIAIFEYSPSDENQQIDGVRISYLKVSCTITGYQEDPNELGLTYRGARSYWKDQPGIEDYLNTVQQYYACFGAVLEVSVGLADRPASLGDLPFIMDFEPKKRELYELATKTNERQSRSLEALNVTKSAGTTQSLEVFDIDMGGGGHSQQASFAGTGGGYSYSAPNGQWGTRRMNAEESLASRSTDVGQEKRETFSYATQISQLYHQLDSYHLGTNRAVFFVLPRPHTLETERTFVNGVRNIEGIQEFFLVVARPKDVEHVCVEAYLETGHIGKVPRWENEDIPGTELKTTWTGSYHAQPKGDDDETTVVDDADRVWSVDDNYPGLDYRIKDAVLSSPGATIRYNYDRPNLIDAAPYIFDKNDDFVRVKGRVHSGFANHAVGDDRWEEVTYPFTVDITLVKTRAVERSTDTLFITGRRLCCCPLPVRHALTDGIVYERDIGELPWRQAGPGEPVTVTSANAIHNAVHHAMRRSRADLDHRYDTPVRITQTDFAGRALAGYVPAARRAAVEQAENLSPELRRKLAVLKPGRAGGGRPGDALPDAA
jgi:hypothetical protein